jgi:hypothetical protein
MILLKQALGPYVPLVVPCFRQEKPYSPIVLAEHGVDRGRVIWTWQKADEEDFPEAAAARSRDGLRNVGLFAADARVFSALARFKSEQFTATGRYRAWQERAAAWRATGANPEQRPKEAEFGFADLMKVMPPEGVEVVAAGIARPSDRLNVNKMEDVQDVKGLYRQQSPYLQPMIERLPKQAVVRFYALDSDKRVVRQNGLPAVLNYTSLLTHKTQPHDSAEMQRMIDKHLRQLGSRIEKELDLVVLPAQDGVIE